MKQTIKQKARLLFKQIKKNKQKNINWNYKVVGCCGGLTKELRQMDV